MQVLYLGVLLELHLGQEAMPVSSCVRGTFSLLKQFKIEHFMLLL